MPFPRTKFQKFAGGACPRTPLEICRHFGHVLYGAKSQLASPAEQKPARHWMCVIIDEIKYSKLNCNLSWILLEANSRHTMTTHNTPWHRFFYKSPPRTFDLIKKLPIVYTIYACDVDKYCAVAKDKPHQRCTYQTCSFIST